MKYFLYGLLILFGISFSYSSAEACTITSVRWNVGFARVGDTIKAQVLARDCQNATFSVDIYEKDGTSDPLSGSDSILDDTLQTNLVGRFQDNGAFGEVSFRLLQADYIQGGNEVGSEEIYFKLTTESIFLAVESNVIGFQTTITPTPPSGGQPAPGQPGQPLDFNFSFDNPFGPDGPTNLLELIEEVARWIMALAIPIAVIMIIYGGILFLTAGQKPDNVKKGKEILKYAIIGLAIVLIGNGFVSLVRSVIELGGDQETESQSQPQFPPEDDPPVGQGGLGASCTNDSECRSGLVCDSRNECHAPITNKKARGESCLIDDECLSDRCDSNSGQINVCF